MAKSNITLPDGTTIKIEGSTTEISKILSVYKNNAETISLKKDQKTSTITSKRDKAEAKEADKIIEIVSAIKNSDYIEEIEMNILDKSSQVDRVLLPLYIVMHDFDNNISLSSTDIYKILKELGVHMALPNISRTLKKTGLKYIIPEKSTKKHESTSFNISLSGRKYIENLLSK